ncbi:AMP-binding protein [Thiocapsa imhoffii]|nr:AMP-binding protein [Thiocapsa imhoffii]
MLQQQGVRARQVVICPDSPALDLVLMREALMRLGAALFPMRSGMSSDDILVLASSCGAEWRWCSRAGLVQSTGVAGPPDAPAAALLVKTSGSSGEPKIVMLARDALDAAADIANHWLAFGPEDRWLCCLRLSHIAGLAILHRWWRAGAGLVLHEGFDAARLAQDLQRQAVTHVSLVPVMLDRLLAIGAPPPASLRVVLIGGQALSTRLARRALAAGWPLYPTYGMTETGAQIATSATSLTQIPEAGRIGPLLPGVEIDHPGTGDEPKPIRIRGPMLMAGYANPARRPGQGLLGDWFATSDLGWVDQDGTLTVVGRVDEIVLIGGQKIALPRIAEQVLRAPGVQELEIVGLDDSVWGCRLVVVYAGTIDEARLAAWCKQQLAGAERPRAFKRIAALPRLATGKHDRVAIRALAQDGV